MYDDKIMKHLKDGWNLLEIKMGLKILEGKENVTWVVEIDEEGITNQKSFTDTEEATNYFIQEIYMFLKYFDMDDVEIKDIINTAIQDRKFEDTNNYYSITASRMKN